MADSYAHQYNARNALTIAGYTPRVLDAFILGSNGPDPLFFYQMHNPFRRYSLDKLGTYMHNHKTGAFLQNLFRLAQTDAQKDYCLGFLCHYSLDSNLHPYVNYITSAYGLPYNIPSGHGYFESTLDSLISFDATGQYCADVEAYFPEINKMHLDQIVALFKSAVDATYPEEVYSRKEYLQAFKDFKSIKNLFKTSFPCKRTTCYVVEKILGAKEGFVASHLQPCVREIKEIPMWLNQSVELFCTDSLKTILSRADQMSADYINVGLEYFKGKYSLGDLLEDIGNKSYETGIVIND